MYSIYRKNQRRHVTCFTITRMDKGVAQPSPAPDLMDIELIAFSTDRAMMVRGFEEIDGARYYQAWYITWGQP